MVAADDEEKGVVNEGWKPFLGMSMFTGGHLNARSALTEEQRNELASDIHDLISSKYEEWGIEPPEPILSDEQRSELKEYIEGLREERYTPKEIRELIAEKLKEWNIDLPPLPEIPCRFRPGSRFMKGFPGGMGM
jgi:hypothetical protein